MVATVKVGCARDYLDPCRNLRRPVVAQLPKHLGSHRTTNPIPKILLKLTPSFGMSFSDSMNGPDNRRPSSLECRRESSQSCRTPECPFSRRLFLEAPK